MFGNAALVFDEFRDMLKKQISFNEQAGTVSAEALGEMSRLMGIRPELIVEWAQGLARPTPHQERSYIALMRSVTLHSPAKVVEVSTEPGDTTPQ